jgi:hypothetical protein
MLTRKARFGDHVLHPSELNRVLELFDRVGLEAAQGMLGRWQRDPAFLDAMRILSSEDSEGPGANGGGTSDSNGNSESS